VPSAQRTLDSFCCGERCSGREGQGSQAAVQRLVAKSGALLVGSALNEKLRIIAMLHCAHRIRPQQTHAHSQHTPVPAIDSQSRGQSMMRRDDSECFERRLGSPFLRRPQWTEHMQSRAPNLRTTTPTKKNLFYFQTFFPPCRGDRVTRD
jgi:hypothetical protein